MLLAVYLHLILLHVPPNYYIFDVTFSCLTWALPCIAQRKPMFHLVLRPSHLPADHRWVIASAPCMFYMALT